MEHAHRSPAEPRRRFLRRMGATLAAGVGVAAFGSGTARAGTQACVYYCRPLDCAWGYPSLTGGDGIAFECRNYCEGTTDYLCLSRSCGSHCLATVC